MKKLVLLLIICICTTLYGYGQFGVFRTMRDVGLKRQIDNCTLRITYQTTIAKDTLNPANVYVDNQALEIGENICRYYSLFAENIDSVLWNARRSKSGNSNQEVDLYKNLSRNQDGTFEDIFSPRSRSFSIENEREVVTQLCEQYAYQYKEQIDKIEWLIEPNIDNILGYECQVATCIFRGRCWKVWFTIEIPLPYGPWKLGGLPGLILKAIDDKNLFEFIAIGINVPQNESIYRYNVPMIKISRLQMLKILNMRWRDPLTLFKTLHPGGEVVIRTDDKKPITQLPYIPTLELW